MDKVRNPIEIAAAGTVLTGTLALASATPTKLGSMRDAFVWVDYTRNVGSATGRPMLAVEISRDSPDTAAGSVSHWTRVTIGDGSLFSSGAVELYYEELDFPTGSTATYHWPDISVAGAWWLRAYVADKDGANPGTCAVYLTGGV